MSRARSILNVMITFLLSGLWHGASWNFVVWGGIHGLAQIYENAFEIKKQDNDNLYSWIRRGIVFAFVTFAWIFFRANNIHEAVYAFKSIWRGLADIKSYFASGINELGLNAQTIPLLLLYIVPLAIYDFCSLKMDPIEWLGTKNRYFQHFVMAMIVFLLLFWGYVGRSTFVYFQF